MAGNSKPGLILIEAVGENPERCGIRLGAIQLSLQGRQPQILGPLALRRFGGAFKNRSSC
jgi:hypothetical protein